MPSSEFDELSAAQIELEKGNYGGQPSGQPLPASWYGHVNYSVVATSCC